MRDWNQRNRVYKNELDRLYYHTHKDEHREYKRGWRNRNREHKRKKNKEWVLANPEKMAAMVRRWKDNNRDKVLAQRTRQNAKRQSNPVFRLRKAMSTAVSLALRTKGKKGGRSWEKLVGYKVVDLVTHLESMFSEGMNWDNYGWGPGKWTVDHIVAQSKFNITGCGCEEFRKCWSLENLQPMWFIDNSSKGSKEYHHVQKGSYFLATA